MVVYLWGFPGDSVGRLCLQYMQCKRLKFDPWAKKIPWKKARQPTPAFLPGEPHGQRSLAGYGPWDRKESDMMEVTENAQCIYVRSNLPIIPPQPPHSPGPMSTHSFSTSASLFLFWNWTIFPLYHFSRFHIRALMYNICFSLSDLLRSIWQTLSLSTSPQMTQFHSSLWVSNIPWYICTNLHYPFICRWTLELFPYPSCCKQCCNNTGIHVNFWIMCLNNETLEVALICSWCCFWIPKYGMWLVTTLRRLSKHVWGFPRWLGGKSPPATAGNRGDLGLILGSERSPEEENGNHGIPAWKIPWTKDPDGL